jgi:hypothetical protein
MNIDLFENLFLIYYISIDLNNLILEFLFFLNVK